MKVLYISHIDWNWIKQRPQFLAEEMANECSLTYVYGKIIGQNRKTRNVWNKRIRYIVIPLLPLTRFKLICSINSIISKGLKRLIMASTKADVIWTADCHGTYLFRKGVKTVYEVMDLYGEMSTDPHEKEQIMKDERIMLEKADHVVVTSLYIQQYLEKTYGTNPEKISLIRNGFFKNDKLVENRNKAISNGNKVKLAYVGTVASWFNWEMIKRSIEEIPEVEYHIIGPVVDKPNIELPEDRVRFYGAVKHEKLAEIIQDKNILIMPFYVNEIVKAVDPVKLYEYIAFGKDIICIRYPEVERFKDYVYFYNTQEEYVNAIRAICREPGAKYSAEQAERFLEENNWKTRAKEAIALCKKVMK